MDAHFNFIVNYNYRPNNMDDYNTGTSKTNPKQNLLSR